MAKILIIEDRQDIVEILDDLLTDEGYQLVFAQNRADAVTAAVTELPDLILADMAIPDSAESQEVQEFAGLEATKEIKANPATRNIPVIATTANAMLHDQEKIKDAGCDDIESKPYEFMSLLDTIEKYLDR